MKWATAFGRVALGVDADREDADLIARARQAGRGAPG